MSQHDHQSHPAIVNRLKRAEGHIRSIVGMFEAGRPCLDLAQQLHAVEKAICEAKKTLIRDHLDHCLSETAEALPAEHRRSIDDFREITKYL